VFIKNGSSGRVLTDQFGQGSRSSLFILTELQEKSCDCHLFRRIVLTNTFPKEFTSASTDSFDIFKGSVNRDSKVSYGDKVFKIISLIN